MNDKKKLEIVWEENDTDFDDELSGESQQQNASFADLLKGESFENESVHVGDQVKGIISAINPLADEVIVELGIKNTGVIKRQELENSDGVLTANAGDELSAFVVSKKGGHILLSKTLSQSAQAADDLKNAQVNQIPVRGKVVKENKGGFEVSIFGKSAFCPVSQIDLSFVEDKSAFIGREYNFLITKMEGTRNIVVSRSALLAKEQQAKIDELKKTLSSEQVFEATIKDLKDFGAVVETKDGIEGLVHISQMSYGRIAHPKDLYKKGDRVYVKILKIEEEKGRPRISMSIKAAQVNPWDKVQELFQVSEKYPGKITRLEKYGAFVELMTGIEGLVHISEMTWGKRILHPSEILKVGDMVTCTVLGIDPINRQISLTIKDIQQDPWAQIEGKLSVGTLVQGKVDRLKDFGAFVELMDGIQGLLPIAIIKKAFGESYRKKISPPLTIEVKILNIDLNEKRILLGLKEVAENDMAEQLAAVREYQASLLKKQQEKEGRTQLGSLGALLQSKMDQKRN